LNKKIFLLFFFIFINFPLGDKLGLGSSFNILRIHFLDVGYGDAFFLEFPDSSTMMIDSGEEEYAPRVLDYLRSLSVSDIDTVIISHPHTNHFAAFKQIIEELPVGRIFINEDKNAEGNYFELLKDWRQRNIPVDSLQAGDAVNHLPRSVSLKILHPKEMRGNPNDNSFVCWLRYKNVSFLFMADIEAQGQKDLLKNFRHFKKIDVVKWPHHGGHFNDDLIKQLPNKIFIISTGLNPWGYPRPEDIQKIKGKIYRTDRAGTIVIETDGKSITVK